MLTIEIEGLNEFRRTWVDSLYVVAEGVRKGVDAGVREGANEARSQHTYKDRTGALTRSIYGKLTGYDRLSATGEMGAKADYASYVEEGTKAHEIRPKEGHGFVGPLMSGQSRRSKTDIGTHRVALRWFDDPAGKTGIHFARVIHHPGSAAKPYMGFAYNKCEAVIFREVELSIIAAQAHLDKAA